VSPAWLFGIDAHLSVGQECARAVVIFAYGSLLVRVAGRRAFARWSALDIVVSIVVGSNLSRALTGSAPLVGTLAATTVLMVLHWVLAQGAARSPLLSRWLEGPAVVLAVRDRIDDRQRVWHAVSQADMDEAVRQHGLAGMDQVERVTLEPSGTISVLGRK
jgi:uncharacterized membrane protein YcaP (DUF421 family)